MTEIQMTKTPIKPLYSIKAAQLRIVYLEHSNIDDLLKVGKHLFLSFRRKPESSIFNYFQRDWTPVFTEVTTFYETVNIGI